MTHSAASFATEAPASGQEALIQFLYQAPVGLVQTTLDGEITMINPMSAQLLMPLAPDGNLLNLFDVLAQVAPGLRELATRWHEPGALICDGVHLTLSTAVLRGYPVKTLALRLMKLDEDKLVASLADITSAVQQQEQRLVERLHDATRIDALTSLPNRTVAVERIEAALQKARAEPDYLFAVLFVNCDRFNRVNVTLGQAAGDQLLRQMADRLNSTVRLRDAVARAAQPEQTAARLGGDEFVVVLEGLRCADDLPGVLQRLIDTLCKPYRIDDQAVHATASIGVVQGDQSAGDADSVLQDASLAMRDAKRTGGARYCVFEPVMKERAWRRGSLEGELRQGIAEGQLFVVYQPIVHLDSGDVAGFEALVRWRHPVRGIVSPIEFIEIAEETGLIGPLGEFVLNTACRQFVSWQSQLGEQSLRVLSVNLSRAQLREPGLIDQVHQALQASGLAARHLQLEVTESLAAQDAVIQARLHELKALGLSLALDDFGTGYSSLASLHQMPIDVVKIDRSFVSQIETSAHHRVLVEATVQVARSLGMRTVAEGIETPGQAAILTALHCDKGQGYLYARPLTPDLAATWLAEQGAARVSRQPAAIAAADAGRPPLSAEQPTPPEATAAKLLECLAQSPLAVALFDPEERLAYANGSYLQLHWDGLTGAPTWEAVMRHAHRRRRGVVIDTDNIEAWLADVRRRYRQQPLRTFESDISDGRWMRVTEETRADGWQLCLSTDVTSLKVNEAALRQARDTALLASITDPLTNLPNRRFVLQQLTERMAEAVAVRTPLTVVAIDLDNFKAINDVHGHGVGDQVLVEFAEVMIDSLRAHDAVGRIGGEEFLLVLPNTHKEGAERVLGTLRVKVQESLSRQPGVPGLRPGFSSGIAEVHSGDSVESVCQRADRGLYLAKAEGRGRDCFVPASFLP